MPIFGAVLGFIAGAFIGNIIANLVIPFTGTLAMFFPVAIILVLGLAIYGTWLGYRTLPI